MSYAFDYDLTEKEAVRGAKLIRVAVYPALWRWAVEFHGFVIGLSIAVAGFFLSAAILRLAGIRFSERLFLYNALTLLFIVLVLLSGRVLRRLPMRKKLESALMRGQHVALSSDGIRFSNDRSHSFTDWRDISSLRSAKGLTIAIYGDTGFAFPDRILALAGDLEAVKAQLFRWHAEANA